MRVEQVDVVDCRMRDLDMQQGLRRRFRCSIAGKVWARDPAGLDLGEVLRGSAFDQADDTLVPAQSL